MWPWVLKELTLYWPWNLSKIDCKKLWYEWKTSQISICKNWWFRRSCSVIKIHTKNDGQLFHQKERKITLNNRKVFQLFEKNITNKRQQFKHRKVKYFNQLVTWICKWRSQIYYQMDWGQLKNRCCLKNYAESLSYCLIRIAFPI